MAAFASVGDLSNYLKAELDQSSAELALDLVSDEIRAELGWSVTQETGVTATRDGGKCSSEIFLPTLYLTAVTSVTEDGDVLTQGTDYIFETSGILTRVRSGYPIAWSDKPLSVDVTYTHGYPAGQVPGVFRSVTLELAARAYSNPANARSSITVGQVSETFSIHNKLVHESPYSRLDRYRLPDGIA